MSQAIIYEVNLTVEHALDNEYSQWLSEHIDAMLQLPGFIKASRYRVQDSDDKEHIQWCVHYYLVDQNALNHYLANYAATMRADGERHFGNRFSASRRTLVINNE